jgi:hypothetical protein
MLPGDASPPPRFGFLEPFERYFLVYPKGPPRYNRAFVVPMGVLAMALMLVWLGMLLLLGFWSLGVWLLYAAAAWAVGQAGALSGVPGLVQALELPAWLGPWVPPELVPVFTGLLGALEPLMALMIQWAPALGGGLLLLAWALWGLGLVMILLLGLALTALVLFLRRSSAGRWARVLKPAAAEAVGTPHHAIPPRRF